MVGGAVDLEWRRKTTTQKWVGIRGTSSTLSNFLTELLIFFLICEIVLGKEGSLSMSPAKSSIIFIPFSDTLAGQAGQMNASTRFRCYQNVKALRKLGWLCEVGTKEKIGRIADFDIAVFQKRYFKGDFELAKQFKGSVILDLSDPDWLRFPDRKELIEDMAKRAAHITTSSTKLAEHFTKEGYKAICITEGFDFDTMPKDVVKHKDLTLCWHGNSRNEQYLSLIAKPLNALVKEFGVTLEVIVNLSTTKIPHLSFNPKLVRWELGTHLKEIAKCHIGIAPLALDEWCSTKCPHKLFTYMALSLPIVGTSIQSYREVIKNDINGFIIKNNNPDEWYKALKTLITDENKRASVVEEGKKTAREFSVDKMARKWDKLFTKLKGG